MLEMISKEKIDEILFCPLNIIKLAHYLRTDLYAMYLGEKTFEGLSHEQSLDSIQVFVQENLKREKLIEVLKRNNLEFSDEYSTDELFSVLMPSGQEESGLLSLNFLPNREMKTINKSEKIFYIPITEHYAVYRNVERFTGYLLTEEGVCTIEELSGKMETFESNVGNNIFIAHSSIEKEKDLNLEKIKEHSLQKPYTQVRKSEEYEMLDLKLYELNSDGQLSILS